MKEVKNLVSLNVKDQPISKVLETIQESLDQNLIYSKTVLTNQNGDEHLITAKIEKVEPETALFMIIKALGMIVEEFENGHLIIRAPELEDDFDKDEEALGEDFDDEGLRY
jgi:type II secretory pathway component GspD/PulD (secretin)